MIFYSYLKNVPTSRRHVFSPSFIIKLRLRILKITIIVEKHMVYRASELIRLFIYRAVSGHRRRYCRDFKASMQCLEQLSSAY